MSRQCGVTGKRVMSGNNVSHAKNRTRRKFIPNLQNASFVSEVLGRSVQVRLSTKGIRTIEIKGGLDAFCIDTPAMRLSGNMLTLKKQICKAAEKVIEKAAA